MDVDEQAFFHHVLTVADVRVRALELAPCGDPECDCCERTNRLLYFAKPDSRYDEWLFILADGIENVLELDSKVHSLFESDFNLDNLVVLSALVGAPWAMVRHDPTRVQAAQRRTSRMLGDGGHEALREMGADDCREQFGLAHELWHDAIEDEPK